jgi:hypothetical protein
MAVVIVESALFLVAIYKQVWQTGYFVELLSPLDGITREWLFSFYGPDPWSSSAGATERVLA